MARRKRLTPPGRASEAPSGRSEAGPSTSLPPIAQVSGDAALAAALEEVAGTLQAAQSEGRLIQALPLSAVVEDYLIRDRLALDDDEMQSLMQSLEARGQQTPIEVVALEAGRFGLISGWRRCQALRVLQERKGDGEEAQVLALVRRPEDRARAYVAMVEENEIRADLSFFERARVVRQALADGVYESEKQALQSLFSAATWSRRSKIKSFLPVVAALDGHLRFPARVSERLGLQLSRLLTAPEGAKRARTLVSALKRTAPDTPEAERAVLQAWLANGGDAPSQSQMPGARAHPPSPASARPAVEMVSSGLKLTARPGSVMLEGDEVDEALISGLREWLTSRG